LARWNGFGKKLLTGSWLELLTREPVKSSSCRDPGSSRRPGSYLKTDYLLSGAHVESFMSLDFKNNNPEYLLLFEIIIHKRWQQSCIFQIWFAIAVLSRFRIFSLFKAMWFLQLG
jgi:hypothetical protein